MKAEYKILKVYQKKHPLKEGDLKVHDKYCNSNDCYYQWEKIKMDGTIHKIKHFHCKALEKIEKKALKEVVT